MQARLAQGYDLLGRSTRTPVARVGVAWYHAGVAAPELRLHAADGSHPSVAGSYLAASVIHAGLAAPGSGTPRYRPRDLGPADAALLQRIAGHADLRAARLGALPIPR
jgi:hypothetical protein